MRISGNGPLAGVLGRLEALPRLFAPGVCVRLQPLPEASLAEAWQTGLNDCQAMQGQLRGDRVILQGDNPTELVQSMRDNNPYPEPTAQTFMDAYAHRMKLWDKSVIRTTSAVEFVEDLARVGELHLWGDHPPEGYQA